MKNRYQEQIFDERGSSFLTIENPPIPEGYKHVCGEPNNGFVIERIIDGSWFRWVNVKDLEANGTLDGKNFNSQLGRRFYPYLYNVISNDYREEHVMRYILENVDSLCELFEKALIGGLQDTLKSCEKYGGFYISCYYISESSESKPQSVKDVEPWSNEWASNVLKIASSFENNEFITSHLMFKAERDTVIEELIERYPGDKNRYRTELLSDLAYKLQLNCGNRIPFKTGERAINNLYDFTYRYLNEWTYENAMTPWYYYSFIHNVELLHPDYSDPEHMARDRQYGFFPTMWIPKNGYTHKRANINRESNAFRIVLCLK